MNRLITDNLATWTTAPNGMKKLRELILELAVRGLLVSQDPNDEPASALLEKIAAEKANPPRPPFKRGEKVPPFGKGGLGGIRESEKPFVLPKGWKWTKLGEISQINPRNNIDDELEVSFIPMTLISTSHKGKHQQDKRQWSEIKTGFTHFAEGDIGIAKITPCFENSKAAVFSELFNGYGAGTTELHIVRPFKETLLPRYVLIYFKSPQFLLVGETKMTGTAGQKRLPREFVTNNPFPLPPLAEQHRIVAKVDELMQLCDQLEQKQSHSQQTHRQLVSTLLTTLTEAHDAQAFQAAWSRIAANFDALFTTLSSVEQLQQTILQLAVRGVVVPQNPDDEPASALLKKIAEEKARLIAEGKIRKQNPLPKISDSEKPFVLPSGWEWVRISSFTQVGTGSTPSRTNPLYYSPAQISWVTSGETQQDFIFETREKISPLAVKETNVSVYPIGSLIVAMYGQGKTRGQVSELMIEAGTNQACAVIQFIEQSEEHRKYIKLFFKKAYEELRSHSAGGAQPNLNVGKISSTVISLPPLSEQHRIVAKVDELMTLCEHLKTKLQTAQTLQQQLAQTLVQKAVV